MLNNINKGKNKFRFSLKRKKKIAYIYIRKNHSNLFITLTDKIGQTIICKTAALVLGKMERRRRRKSHYILDIMLNSFNKYFDLYKIQGIKLFLRMRPGQFLKKLIQ